MREAPGLDAALHRARHMDPKASSTRDSTQWDVWRGGATIFREGVVSIGRIKSISNKCYTAGTDPRDNMGEVAALADGVHGVIMLGYGGGASFVLLGS